MKINNNNYTGFSKINSFKNKTTSAQSTGLSETNESNVKNNKNFDNIIISSLNSNEDSTDTVINDLKNKIMSDIKSPAPQNKINDLKSQIALGEYQINTHDIVKKILLY